MTSATGYGDPNCASPHTRVCAKLISALHSIFLDSESEAFIRGRSPVPLVTRSRRSLYLMIGSSFRPPAYSISVYVYPYIGVYDDSNAIPNALDALTAVG